MLAEGDPANLSLRELAPPHAIHRDLLAEGQLAFGSLLRALEAGQRTGQIVASEPRDLAVAAWSQVHGLATLLLDGQLDVSSEAECEKLVRRCLHIQLTGLLPGDQPENAHS